MKTRIIVDSTVDVPEELRARMHIAPLHVRFGDEEFIDGVTITSREFYQRLMNSEVLPASSQPSPDSFEKIYEEVTAAGDEAVVLTISSKLSGTYQSACIAAEEFEGKIFVVDSMSATIGERLLLQYGIRLAHEGLDAASIAGKLDEIKDRIRIYARLDTLEYLKKGGRISGATAVVGTMLNIKPIIAVQDGVVANVGKARGPKAADKQLRELVAKSGGIDFSKPLCAAWSGLEDDNLKTFLAESGELFCGTEVPVATVGCVIGAHVGPGAVALAYFAN